MWPGAQLKINEDQKGNITNPLTFYSDAMKEMLRIRIRRIRTGTYVFGPPGSGSGSIRQKYGSGSFYRQPKIVRKTMIPTALWILFDFLSLTNDVNLPSKSSN